MNNITHLKSLQLVENNFIGQLPQKICLGRVLENFTASGNHFTGPIPKGLKNCTSLFRVRLERNQLTGDLAESFGVYPTLNYIDLSSNNFYGELSEKWGQCHMLTNLNISNNNISGAIPPQLGKAIQLQQLDLSANHLSGKIPKELDHIQRASFMTHAMKAIYKLLLSDYVKVSKVSVEDMLYDEQDILCSMDKIEVLDFHQTLEVNGIRFWCYTAGHVLGAAMFMVDIAGVRVLYTGDYSREEDRHLHAAEIPQFCPDTCIIESTYGVQLHQPRHVREKRFTDVVHSTISLGRAQELLLILEEYWSNHPELHNIPIFYASPCKRCMAVYQTSIP
ncbi:hypothetical protein AAG906_021170 [Vitis piasezkii]